MDLASALLAWMLSLAPITLHLLHESPAHRGSGTLRSLAVVVSLAACSVLFAVSQQLYRGRVCEIRSLEAWRIVRVSLMTSLVAMVVPQLFGLDLPLRRIVVGAIAMLVLDVMGRAVYAHWLRSRRTRGRYARSVVLVGDNEEARDLLRLTREHPENGLRMVGMVGRPGATGSTDIDLPWLGTIDDLSGCAAAAGGAVIAASALSSGELNRVVRSLLQSDVHVHMSSALAGVDIRRMRPLPITGEPLFYIEKARRSHAQRIVSRGRSAVTSNAVLRRRPKGA